MTVILDPFTTFAQRGYPVDSRAKSQPPLPTQIPLWGTVIRNDGMTFDVRWDFTGEVTTHDLAVEQQRHAAASADVKQLIESALGRGMRTIELDHQDLASLRFGRDVHVASTTTLIGSPRGDGIAQPGWEIILLTEEQLLALWNGCAVETHNCRIVPPLPADTFSGYRGGRHFDISAVHSPAHRPIA